MHQYVIETFSYSRTAVLAGLALSLTALPAAATAALAADSLVSMTLEELGNVRITSVSKHAERLADAPAAVFVISADDVRHSGVTSLREALRLAPNLQVMQVSAGSYTVTARGFANSAGNKLLVLIDGRSVYTPLFSGVFWDAQDVALDDIERIEVISGPGGTLWGTNAVNGVINVITHPAKATQGGLLSLGAGNQLKDATVRYGGALGDNGAYRVYAKAFTEQHTEDRQGNAVDDAWHKAQIGFRTDWTEGADQFSVQGDAYHGVKGQPKPGTIVTGARFALGDVTIGGVNLTTHWSRELDDGARLSVQAYYDHTERAVVPTFTEELDIVDLQAQYALAPLGRHAIVAGVQLRHAIDHLDNSPYIQFLPADDSQSWTSLFAQDEVTLTDSLRLTLGLRLERNDYTGMEYLPSARLAWKVTPDSLLWGAVSRTVRAPSRLDRDTYVPVRPGLPARLLNGGPDFVSELADVFEVGYRSQVSKRLSYSVNLYRALYDRLHTQDLTPSRTQLVFGNGMKGATSGIETWGSYQATPDWRLSAGFTALHKTLEIKPGVIDTANSALQEGLDPSHTWTVRSSLQLTHDTDFDASVRRVAALSNPDVPAYTAVDMRIGWRLRPDLELSVSGQNLFGPGHAEFTGAATRSLLGRTVLVSLTSRF